MNRLLILQDGLEAQFWQHPSTQRQVWKIIFTGVTFALILDAIFRRAACSQQGTIGIKYHAVIALWLNLAHMGWMMVHRSSYMRQQRKVQLFKRILWVVLAFRLARAPAGQISHRHLRGDAELAPGTWQALLSVLLTVPCHMVINCANHPLPFRYMLMLAIPLLVPSAAYGLQHFMAAVHRFQLQAVMYTACNTCHMLLAGIITGAPSTPTVCRTWQHAAVFAFVFTRLMAGAVLPLNLVYRYERRAKLSFLREQKVQVQHLSLMPDSMARSLFHCTALLWLLLYLGMVLL